VCAELQKAVRHDRNFLSRVITGDESWLYNYGTETKQQSSEWKMPSSPRPKKARQVRSNIKSVLILFFFNIRGIVHKELFHLVRLPGGNFFCEGLRRLRKNVRQKRPEMWKKGDWLLHNDNVAHTSLVVREFLTKNNMTTVPHPACSPDLAPPTISTCSLK